MFRDRDLVTKEGKFSGDIRLPLETVRPTQNMRTDNESLVCPPDKQT